MRFKINDWESFFFLYAFISKTGSRIEMNGILKSKIPNDLLSIDQEALSSKLYPFKISPNFNTFLIKF